MRLVGSWWMTYMINGNMFILLELMTIKFGDQVNIMWKKALSNSLCWHRTIRVLEICILCRYMYNMLSVGEDRINKALYIEGIPPKGPYLPCVSMAGRTLLAGYHRYAKRLSRLGWFLNKWQILFPQIWIPSFITLQLNHTCYWNFIQNINSFVVIFIRRLEELLRITSRHSDGYMRR